MAKKKTAGPDNPIPTPAATRRRSVKNVVNSGTEAAPGATPTIDGAVAETVGTSSTSRTIESAHDMATGADSASEGYAPSYEEIAEAAYHRYLSRGGGHGQDFEDWLEAERELRTRR